MALAQRKVDPRYFGPQLQEYIAKGAYGGGGGASSPHTQSRQQQGQQVDPAAALALMRMFGGEKGTGGLYNEADYSLLGKPLSESLNPGAEGIVGDTWSMSPGAAGMSSYSDTFLPDMLSSLDYW